MTVLRSIVLLFVLTACSSSSTNEDGLFGGEGGVAGQTSTGGVAGVAGGGVGGVAGVAGSVAIDGGSADVKTCKLPEQTQGDCVVAVCDGDGAVLVSDFSDVPADDGNTCTDDVCTTGGLYGLAKPDHPQKAAGASCGNGMVCNSSGACG